MKALDAVLNGIFDYAGMHPPASLSLDDALKASAAFASTLKRPRLVGNDLVLDRKNLSLLTDAKLDAAGFPRGRLIRICFLGSPLEETDPALPPEVDFIQEFNKLGATLAYPRHITSYEIKIPPQAFEYRDLLFRSLRSLRSSLTGEDIILFVEPDLSENHAAIVPALTAALRELNVPGGNPPPIGLKVRGSGPAGIDNEKLSLVIEAVSRGATPLKTTAGMHHPILETARYRNNLGFLNCAVALFLYRALGPKQMTRANILECLNTAAASDFRFDTGLSWKSFSLTEGQLKKVKALHFSVGSCSLSEPDEDLIRLFS